jgi:hypothetical protein
MDTQNMEQRSVKSVYSMMTMVQIISFLYEIWTGRNGVTNRQERKKERAREQVKRVRGEVVGENCK